MKLKYCLHPLPISDKEEECYAKFQEVKTLSEEELINEISMYAGVSEPQVAMILAARNIVIKQQLEKGNNVRDSIARYYLSIQGKFKNKEDRFDKKRHKVLANISFVKSIRFNFDLLKLTKIRAQGKLPQPIKIYDTASQKTNQYITPSKISTIKGFDMQFEDNDPEQGVFIKNHTETIKVENIIQHSAKDIILFIPDQLPKGSLSIIVAGKNHKKDKIKRGTLPYTVKEAPKHSR
ncbi:MAG: DUF4469 domain-containing protein [Hyphomicrobiales bacterium]